MSEAVPASAEWFDSLRALDAPARAAWVDQHVPPSWRASVMGLLDGADPDGALRRAAGLPPQLHASPWHEGLSALLHQGGYAARLIGLLPDAVNETTAPFPTAEALRERMRVEAQTLGVDAAIGRARTRAYLALSHREVVVAPLEEVGAHLSDLVDACVQLALEHAPTRKGEAPLHELVAVLGMGKLGGDELNFFSDIDLVCVHHDHVTSSGDEGADHAAKARLHERLRQALARLEGTGAWRPLFRVDLRLRPFGSRGPLSMSLAATEAYYEAHGRPWERQVWIRARAVAGDLELGRTLIERLTPFVYRRSVGPEIFGEVAAMIDRARRDARRLDLRGGSQADLKHDEGGIREVEFFAQALQLLHGGRNAGLRSASTLGALDRLAAAGLISDREHATLSGSYRLLRRVEHRIQLAEGQHTHRLPADADERDRLARRLGYSDGAGLLEALEVVARDVAPIVTTLRGPDAGPEDPAALARSVLLDPGAPAHRTRAALESLEVDGVDEAQSLLVHLFSRETSPLLTGGRARVGARRLLSACLETEDVTGALRRLAELVRTRPAHSVLWSLLADASAEELTRRVADLLAASEPLSRGLVGFAGARGLSADGGLDLLLEPLGDDLPTPADIEARIEQEVARRDTEAPLEVRLLHAKHRELVRIGVADLAIRPDPLEVGGRLSALADAIVRAVLPEAARSVLPDDAPPLRLSVLAVGKYGMQAMDYGSDLDLMFVFDADDEVTAAQSRAVLVARELLRRLQDRSAGHRLFEVDMRLRPSGRQGALVSSEAGLRQYHRDSLPVWERLALCRLRGVAELNTARLDAEPRLAALSARVVEEVITPSIFRADVDARGVASQVRDLKERIEGELARETRDVLDVKSGRGGCLELELLVAAMGLAHGTLPPPPGAGVPGELNGLRAAGKLEEREADDLEEAYRFFRTLLNRLRMSRGASTLDSPDRVAMNSPRLTGLARRMGLPGRDFLIERLRAHRATVRAAFDRHLPKGHVGD